MGFQEILGLLPHLTYGFEDHPGLFAFILELLFWTVIFLLTLALVRFCPASFEKAETRLREISRLQRFWLVAFGLIVIFVRLALLPLLPVPIPYTHDEFSYLLAADTFSHGRLTNPPSPMWQHFESMHINVQPTYQSMYPPAQGLALALGKILTGIPWAGVLLSTALMCAAIYWMLLGWLPPSWAWLGGALACARYGIFSYWMNSYWGGSVAALGGALVLGAFPRIRQKQKLDVRTGLILAAGLLILANSRPLEGFLFSLPILVSVTIILLKNGNAAWRETLKTALPAVVLLAAGAAGMLYYNWRGTGNPLLMPYVVNWNTYHITRPFFFQAPNPVPRYRFQAMRTFYVMHELPSYMASKYALGELISLRLGVYYSFYLWPFLLLIGPCILAMWRSKFRIVLFSLALVTLVLIPQTWPPQAHYAAPVAGAVFLMLLFSLRHFRNSPSKYGIWASRALAVVFAAWMICPVAESLWDPYNLNPVVPPSVVAGIKVRPMPLDIQRARIQSMLEARGGKHLVIVGYPKFDDPTVEWVYNDADLSSSKVVWARNMGYLGNEELLNYFPDRQVWYVEHSDPIAMILPYGPAAAPIKLAFEYSSSGSPFAQASREARQHASPEYGEPATPGLRLSKVLSP